MSNQNREGWFPECLICFLGNIGEHICLPCGLKGEVDSEKLMAAQNQENYPEPYLRGNHYYLNCFQCQRGTIADGGSYGVYAICLNCYPKFRELLK